MFVRDVWDVGLIGKRIHSEGVVLLGRKGLLNVQVGESGMDGIRALLNHSELPFEVSERVLDVAIMLDGAVTIERAVGDEVSKAILRCH